MRFAEPGARWRTVAYGPVLCLIVLIGDLMVTHRVHWFGLTFCAVLLAGFVSLQVIAGRRHASVELTDTTLREGTETVALADIEEILPPPDDSWDEEKWESARALGELSGVPRRRTGIGLVLRSGGIVQAWARDHHALRAELAAALERLEAAEPGRAPGKATAADESGVSASGSAAEQAAAEGESVSNAEQAGGAARSDSSAGVPGSGAESGAAAGTALESGGDTEPGQQTR